MNDIAPLQEALVSLPDGSMPLDLFLKQHLTPTDGERPRLVAIVDMGSRSIRLDVFDWSLPSRKPVFSYSRVCNLAEGMLPGSGDNLSAEGRKRAKQALARIGTILNKGLRLEPDKRKTPLDHSVVIATAAVRRHAEVHGIQTDFLTTARSLLGNRDIGILSERAEERLVWAGASNSITHYLEEGVVLGTGGGSTECIFLKNGRPIRSCTDEIGVLTLQTIMKDDPTGWAKTINGMLAHHTPMNGVLCLTGGAFRSLGRAVLLQTHRIPIKGQFPDGTFLPWDASTISQIEAASSMRKSCLRKLGGEVAKRRTTFAQTGALLFAYATQLEPKGLVFLDSNIRRGALHVALG